MSLEVSPVSCVNGGAVRWNPPFADLVRASAGQPAGATPPSPGLLAAARVGVYPLPARRSLITPYPSYRRLRAALRPRG